MEDKVLEIMNEFRGKIDEVFVGQTPKLPEDIDNIYNCDIYIYRHLGMGNSKQIIVGDKVSVMTATASYLETLLRKNIIDEKELKEMVEMVLKNKEVK